MEMVAAMAPPRPPTAIAEGDERCTIRPKTNPMTETTPSKAPKTAWVRSSLFSFMSRRHVALELNQVISARPARACSRPRGNVRGFQDDPAAEHPPEISSRGDGISAFCIVAGEERTAVIGHNPRCLNFGSE